MLVTLNGYKASNPVWVGQGRKAITVQAETMYETKRRSKIAKVATDAGPATKYNRAVEAGTEMAKNEIRAEPKAAS